MALRDWIYFFLYFTPSFIFFTVSNFLNQYPSLHVAFKMFLRPQKSISQINWFILSFLKWLLSIPIVSKFNERPKCGSLFMEVTGSILLNAALQTNKHVHSSHFGGNVLQEKILVRVACLQRYLQKAFRYLGWGISGIPEGCKKVLEIC